MVAFEYMYSAEPQDAPPALVAVVKALASDARVVQGVSRELYVEAFQQSPHLLGEAFV